MIKNQTKFLISLLAGLVAVVLLIQSCKALDGYRIDASIDGYTKDTSAYLVQYFGKNQHVKDTAKIQSDGSFLFENQNKLEAGMYFIVAPGESHIELIIDEDQHFSLNTTKGSISRDLKIEGSEENKQYYEYLNFLNEQRSDAETLQKQIREAESDDIRSNLQSELQSINKKVQNFQKQFVEQNSHLFAGQFVKMTLQPEIPEEMDRSGREAFYYYRDHYFDHFDFTDPRTIRTPVFFSRLENYFNELVPKNPDSVIVHADKLVEKAKGNDPLFRFIVHYITSEYERSDIMGMDAVFVHMVNKYYKSGKAFWMSDAQLENVVERAQTLEPLLIGKKAPELNNLMLLDGGRTSLSAVNNTNRFTVLYFWDYDCGHCRRVTPDLYKTYQDYKAHGVEVLTVCTQVDMEKWKDYLTDNDLTDWVNTIDPFHQSQFRQKYDIYSTPVVYILNENREIIAKDIAVSQVRDVLENKLGNDH